MVLLIFLIFLKFDENLCIFLLFKILIVILIIENMKVSIEVVMEIDIYDCFDISLKNFMSLIFYLI